MSNKWKSSIFNTMISLIALFILWEIVVSIFKIPAYLLPPPSKIFIVFVNNFKMLLGNALYTLYEVIVGYVLGILIAGALSLFSVIFTQVRRALFPFVMITICLPIIAYAPFSILWFGFGAFSKIALVACVIFGPVYFSLVKNLRVKDESKEQLLSTLSASNFYIFTNLRFPNSLAVILITLKTIVPLSFFAALAGEFWASSKGIGFVIMSRSTLLDTVYVWAAIFMTCFLGIIFFNAITLIEKILIPWHISIRKL